MDQPHALTMDQFIWGDQINLGAMGSGPQGNHGKMQGTYLMQDVPALSISRESATLAKCSLHMKTAQR